MSEGIDSLEIDVSSVITTKDLHQLLCNAFKFPNYYGNNWDAFDECLNDIEVPRKIQIRGFEKLSKTLPGEAELLSRCLKDFSQEKPKISVRFD